MYNLRLYLLLLIKVLVVGKSHRVAGEIANILSANTYVNLF